MIEAILSRLAKIPSDKVLHFACGTILFAVCLPFTSPRGALAIVALVAALKEGYDAMHKDTHTADIWDFIATVAGGATAFSCT